MKTVFNLFVKVPFWFVVMVIAGIGYVLITPFVWVRKLWWTAQVDAMFEKARKDLNTKAM